jgi:hypothetical protein
MATSPKDEKPIDTTAITVRDPQKPMAVARAEDFMPLMSVDQAIQRKGMMNQFINQVLHEGIEPGEGDYGVMPGAKKKVLFKPGAEKLCSIFGLAPQYTEDKVIEDWTGEHHGGEPLFYYSYRCSLLRGGNFMGEAIGSANTWESKYRYRWVREEDVPGDLELETLPQRGGSRKLFEPDFALEKKETGGKYAKPAEYWSRWDDAIADGVAKPAQKKLGAKMFKGYEMTVDETLFRIPNPDAADVINTCQKMAQKRALVAAVLVVTNCSDAFTQDIDDMLPPEPGYNQRGNGADEPGRKPATGKTAPAAPRPGPADRPVPAELVKLVERVEKEPGQFGAAVKSLEDALVHKHGSVEGLKRYDAIADSFYAAFPNGTRDIRELKAVLLSLHAEIERPAATPEAAA